MKSTSSTEHSEHRPHRVLELLEAVSKALLADVTPLREDLSQMRSLVQSAIVDLQTSFFGLDAHVQAQNSHAQEMFQTIEATQNALREQLEQATSAICEVRRILGGVASDGSKTLPSVSGSIEAMLDGLDALDRQTGKRLAELERLANAVRENVYGAVRALQFEDMTTQLIDCSTRRLDRVSTVLGHLALLEPPATGDGGAELAPELARLQDELLRHAETRLVSPVGRATVSSDPDVEFF